MRTPLAVKKAAKDLNRFGAIQNTTVHSSLLANYREIYVITEVVPIPDRIHVYFNFENISFEDSRVETSASKVFLCGTSVGYWSGRIDDGTHPVLIYDPHVFRNSLDVIRLCFYLSDLVQVQSCQLQFLFALGDLSIQIDQALEFTTIRKK